MPKLTQTVPDPINTAHAGIGDLFLTMILLDEAALLRGLDAAGVGVNVTDTLGRTLLMLAVTYAATCRGKQKQKILSTITFLLQNGADPNLADSTGATAMSIAIQLRQKAIAKLLHAHCDSPTRIN